MDKDTIELGKYMLIALLVVVILGSVLSITASSSSGCASNMYTAWRVSDEYDRALLWSCMPNMYDYRVDSMDGWAIVIDGSATPKDAGKMAAALHQEQPTGLDPIQVAWCVDTGRMYYVEGTIKEYSVSCK